MTEGPPRAGSRAAERAASARAGAGARLRPGAANEPGPAAVANGSASPFTNPAHARAWRTDRWNEVTCLAVWDETHDVKSFRLAPKDGSRLAFEAGQFMTFRFGALDGQPPEALERAYTISSSGAQDRAFTITVKRKPDGAISPIVHDRLRPGVTIEAWGPSGRFSPSQYAGSAFCLLSGGAGITPMLSTVRTAADLGIDLDAVFVHAARTPADIIAADELAILARRLPRLRVVMVPTAADAGWRGASGLIDAARLGELVPDLKDRQVMCCGPAPFMAAMREACRSAGVPDSAYGEESFEFGTVASEPEPMTTEGAPSRTITFKRSGKRFECPEGFTILQAAKRAGIPMPSSCAKGICGTCKCLKLSGHVTMDHGGGIREREIARGFVLPCSSYALTDIVLDR